MDDKEMNDLDTKSKDKMIIPDWLEAYESPFHWNSHEGRSGGHNDVVIQRSIEKIEELKFEEPDLSLQRFASLLTLVLEYYIADDMDKMNGNMKTIDELLVKEETRDDPQYEQMKLPLNHVISSTSAFLLAHDNDEEKAKKIVRNVIPVKMMTDQEQAVIYALKARFFLYSGYELSKNNAVDLARKALELDPENPEWEYLLAKMLRQKRKDAPFSMNIPKEELVLLEKAADKSKNVKFLVYLAQVYRECAHQAFFTYKNQPRFFRSELCASIDEMQVKAFNYYKEALDLNPNNPSVLRRVGYGIMNLPKKFANYDLALKCLLRSQELADSIVTCHILGTFYKRFTNDNAKALEYFERCAKAGMHLGMCDMIRIKYILHHNYNPMPDFEAGLKNEGKKNYRVDIFAQQGGYVLFIVRNFIQSIEYFRQAITEDKDSPYLKEFKSIFLRMYEAINLYKYLANEALLFLQKHSDSTLESDNENIRSVESFIDMISEIRPECVNITPDASLVTRLIQMSRENTHKENMRKKF